MCLCVAASWFLCMGFCELLESVSLYRSSSFENFWAWLSDSFSGHLSSYPVDAQSLGSEEFEPGWWKLAPFPALCEFHALLLWSFRVIHSLVRRFPHLYAHVPSLWAYPIKIQHTASLATSVTLTLIILLSTFWHSKLYNDRNFCLLCSLLYVSPASRTVPHI